MLEDIIGLIVYILIVAAVFVVFGIPFTWYYIALAFLISCGIPAGIIFIILVIFLVFSVLAVGYEYVKGKL